MSASLRTTKMAQRHEPHLVDLFDGRPTRGSGNTWVDQTDGKHRIGSRTYRWSWEAKSTLAKSWSLSLKTWRKAVEQTEAGLLTMLPVRFYADERLTRVEEDLVVVDAQILADILEDAELGAAAREAGWVPEEPS